MLRNRRWLRIRLVHLSTIVRVCRTSAVSTYKRIWVEYRCRAECGRTGGCPHLRSVAILRTSLGVLGMRGGAVQSGTPCQVIDTPEVSRVFIGSFWDEPLSNDEQRRLFESEDGIDSVLSSSS